MQHEFPVIYWGEDTRAQFHAHTDIPDRQLTACMVIALTPEGRVALSRPARGWGILGGHIEGGETPEECIVREAMEEGGVSIANLEIVGSWHTEKLFATERNAGYPEKGCMLLYIADITKVHPYEPQFEIMERMLIPFEQLPDYHHDFAGNFDAIYRYVTGLLEERQA